MSLKRIYHLVLLLFCLQTVSIVHAKEGLTAEGNQVSAAANKTIKLLSIRTPRNGSTTSQRRLATRTSSSLTSTGADATSGRT